MGFSDGLWALTVELVSNRQASICCACEMLSLFFSLQATVCGPVPEVDMLGVHRLLCVFCALWLTAMPQMRKQAQRSISIWAVGLYMALQGSSLYLPVPCF